MCHRTGEVVNHELEDGLDLFLIVTSIVSQCRVLFELVMLIVQKEMWQSLPSHLCQGSFVPSTLRQQLCDLGDSA
jgi:hypothetical protein